MPALSGSASAASLYDAVLAARALAADEMDYRDALCRFEDDLFAAFPAGHEIVSYGEAVRMVGEVFRASARAAPRLDLVPGFEDPRIGGYADIARHRIAIEKGFLYRFLVLHECAHILVPEDRLHGTAFIHVLHHLYRRFIGIPESALRLFLARHGLPEAIELPAPPPFALAS